MRVTLLSIIIILLLLLGCNRERGNQSNEALDSLEIYIENAKNTADSSAFKFNNRALELVLSKLNDSISRARLFEISNNYFLQDRLDEFKVSNQISLQKAMEGKDTSSIAKAYRYQAEYYKYIQRYDSAFTYFINSEKFYRKLDDKNNLGRVLYKKAIIQFDVGDFTGADLSITQAFTLLKNGDDKQIIYQTLSMTGIIANALEDYDRAIEYHNKALEIVRGSELDPTLTQEASTLNNLGGVYQNLNKNDEAISNFNTALKSPNLLKLNPDLYARLLDNLAYSKLKLKDLRGLPDLFYRALKIREDEKLQSAVIASKIHLSEYFAIVADTVRALKFANDALVVGRNSNSQVDVMVALKQAGKIDQRNASRYNEEYIKLNDILQKEERNSKDKFSKIQLETKEILSENDKLYQQNRNLLYFFVGTLMIGMLLFVIRSQRAKNRELLLKQAQQKANEDIYNLMITQQNTIEESRIREKKRIAQELHDGVLGRLFGARLNLDSLNRMATQEAAKKRSDYLAELKNIEQDIREISHDLNREKYVLINNFIAILNNLIEEQQASFAPDVQFIIDDRIQWDALSNTSKINLYRIIQESLQNINKYANATLIKLEVKKIGENLVLNVTDNGVGFTVSGKKKGIGLQNMISRTHELNGSFDVRSKKGKGTTIHIIFPIQTNNNFAIS